MKKYALLLMSLVFAFGIQINAQNPNGKPMPSAEKRAERLAKQLNLTSEQKASVQTVYEKYDADFAKLREEAKTGDKSAREKFKTLREAQENELKEAIGQDKYDQMVKMRTERMEKMKERQNGGEAN